MHKFYVNDNAIMKNLLIDGNHIQASDDNFGDETTFNEKMNGKKSLLDTRDDFTTDQITKYIPYPHDMMVQIFLDKDKKLYQFATRTEYDEFTNYLNTQTHYKPHRETVGGGVSAWIKPGLYTLIAAILTVSLYGISKQLQAGESVSVSGSRRGLKRLMISAAEALGPTGTLIVGFLVVAYFGYRTYTSIAESKEELDVYTP